MSFHRDTERRLSDYYAAEASSRAPHRVLQRALDTVDTTSQRRSLLAVPWGFRPMGTLRKVALTAAAASAVAATGIAVLRPDASMPVGAPGVSASPSPSPGITSRVGELTADPFQPPFTYVLPAGEEFAYGNRTASYFEVRVPAAAEAGRPKGVIVQTIGGGRTDPCSSSGEDRPLPIRPGSEAVIDYLKTVPGLEVTDESPTAVGDLPAHHALVRPKPGPGCEEISPWAEDIESFVPVPVRVIAVDVRGEHVVITIFGEDTNLGWTRTADELINSFRFLPPASSP